MKNPDLENKDAAPQPKRRAVDQTPEDRDAELRAKAPRVRVIDRAKEGAQPEEVDAYTARERLTAAGSTWERAE